MRAEGSGERQPPIDDDQRAIPVRIERHFVSECRSLSTAFQTAKGHGSGVQFAGKSVGEGGHAAKKLLLGETGETGDAQNGLRP
jgi:hypothetical protein